MTRPETGRESACSTGQPFCLIGGLAVNHYVEPGHVRCGFAIAAAGGVIEALAGRGFQVQEFHPSMRNCPAAACAANHRQLATPDFPVAPWQERSWATKSRSLL